MIKAIKKITKKTTKAATAKKKQAAAKTKKAPRRKSVSYEDFSALVEQKAYELYESRGYSHGSDQNDWFEAEKAVKVLYKVK